MAGGRSGRRVGCSQQLPAPHRQRLPWQLEPQCGSGVVLETQPGVYFFSFPSPLSPSSLNKCSLCLSQMEKIAALLSYLFYKEGLINSEDSGSKFVGSLFFSSPQGVRDGLAHPEANLAPGR